MKTERTFVSCTVTPKQEKRIQAGHPWVYGEEITEISGTPENGSIVDVFGRKHNYLGSGMYSEVSKIRVRLLDRNANEKFDEAFFRRRISYALKYRHDVMKEDMRNCRLVFGEADGLPGLTVDKYDDILVSEITSYGMEMRRQQIYRDITEELAKYGYTVNGIYERNDGALREKEGLARYSSWHESSLHPRDIVTISEHGILYETDIINGQKTGFFLDQKYNRLQVRRLSADMTVLDCCTHTGAFALNAAYGGAKEVTALDISEAALETARRNAVLNHLEEKVTFIRGDVFDTLQEYVREKRKYDLVILDPPAFTKSHSTAANAAKGYEKINTAGMRILRRGGYLVSCSCSHFMETESFRGMLEKAALNAGVRARIVEEAHASPDHPRMLGVPETDYLKFFILQIS